MQGMRFLILNEEGKPINHGIIAQRITPEKYLCSFTRNPPVARVCDLTEIQGWNLFPTDDAMNAFIESIQKDLNKTPPPPADTTAGVGRKRKKKVTPAMERTAKKRAAKKSAKKSTRSKSNGQS